MSRTKKDRPRFGADEFVKGITNTDPNFIHREEALFRQ